MSEIRADHSQYYPLKALLEQILGKKSFGRVKDYAPMSVWKSEVTGLIKALSVAIAATVEVADPEWHAETKDIFERGLELVKSAQGPDELFAGLSATLGRLSFLQIGFVPRGHASADRRPLAVKNWRMNVVRTVQYVQTPDQI